MSRRLHLQRRLDTGRCKRESGDQESGNLNWSLDLFLKSELTTYVLREETLTLVSSRAPLQHFPSKH
jgi:hypothetical protein